MIILAGRKKVICFRSSKTMMKQWNGSINYKNNLYSKSYDKALKIDKRDDLAWSNRGKLFKSLNNY